MVDNFKLYKKWFWVGMIIGFLNVVGGLIYGVAMVVEPEHRKEGIIVIVWSLIVFVAVAAWLKTVGY